jgi:hypothetical protein
MTQLKLQQALPENIRPHKKAKPCISGGEVSTSKNNDRFRNTINPLRADSD